MRKKNILVVGGAGYVGGSVTDELLQRKEKYNVRVYDNLLYEESYRKSVDFVFGDILDRKLLKKHLMWADSIIWLAAIVGDGACKWDEVLTKKVNQDSVAWLAENFNGRIVFTSTCSVYGAQNNLILDEESLLSPLSLYAYTKREAEKILKDKNAIIFRLGTLFGISDNYARIRLDLVLNLLTARAYGSNKIDVFGGNQYRPLLHVRDAALSLVKALEYPYQRKAMIFNINKCNIKIFDLAERIKKHLPKTKIKKTNMSFKDTRNYKVTCEKAKKMLKFNPKYDIDFGIKQIIEILKSQRIKNFNNPRYSNQLFLKDMLNK